MRKRQREIKVHLTEAEYNRLTEQVEKTVYSREAFIRAALAGKTVVELPKDYMRFTADMRRIATQLQLMNWNASLSESDKQMLYRLGKEIHETVRQLNDVYFKLENRKD